MSRSYKKNPVNKGNSNKEEKIIANRRVRRKLNDPRFEVANNNGYRKVINSCDICDYVSRWSLEEALLNYRTNSHISFYWKEKYPTEEKFIQAWKKEMIRK